MSNHLLDDLLVLDIASFIAGPLRPRWVNKIFSINEMRPNEGRPDPQLAPGASLISRSPQASPMWAGSSNAKKMAF